MHHSNHSSKMNLFIVISEYLFGNKVTQEKIFFLKTSTIVRLCVLAYSFTTTLMKLLMFLSLSLSKFTSSTLVPALVGLNSMLALASCFGPTASILQESCTTFNEHHQPKISWEKVSVFSFSILMYTAQENMFWWHQMYKCHFSF